MEELEFSPAGEFYNLDFSIVEEELKLLNSNFESFTKTTDEYFDSSFQLLNKIEILSTLSLGILICIFIALVFNIISIFFSNVR